ncbi:unnamed protein product, partial [Timema podura]|nr:unnamed protein product [Timema podura]
MSLPIKIQVTWPLVVYHLLCSATHRPALVTAGSGRGDNYTATLYRVQVEGKVAGKTDPWSRSLIYKCLPMDPAQREAFKSDKLFKNEVAVYTRALPALMDFQNTTIRTNWAQILVYNLKEEIHPRSEKGPVRIQSAFDTKRQPTMLAIKMSLYIDGMFHTMDASSGGDRGLFKAVPQCYLARSDVLVLEDLKTRGFVMVDRKAGLDYHHCK